MLHGADQSGRSSTTMSVDVAAQVKQGCVHVTQVTRE